jgi:hypothetical protein
MIPRRTSTSILNTPLRVHVTRYNTGSESGRGGNSRFKCHFCDGDFPGSYSRVRAHLLKTRCGGVQICSNISHSVHEQLCKEDRDATAIAANSAPKNELIKLPPYENSSLPPSAKKRKGKQTNIADSFTAEERHIADSNIARMFYTGGLHINFVIFLMYYCCVFFKNANFVVLLGTYILQLFPSIWQEIQHTVLLIVTLHTQN